MGTAASCFLDQYLFVVIFLFVAIFCDYTSFTPSNVETMIQRSNVHSVSSIGYFPSSKTVVRSAVASHKSAGIQQELHRVLLSGNVQCIISASYSRKGIAQAKSV